MFDPTLLDNYRNLMEKVDSLCTKANEVLEGHINCRAGCSSCCRHLKLFPVEAYALAIAFHNASSDCQVLLQENAANLSEDSACPLLHEGLCLLYQARPIICRTHGLPLVTGANESKNIDYCHLNLKGLTSLPGHAVLDLERLNMILTAVNAHFTSLFHPLPDRISIAEAIRFQWPERRS